MSKNPNRNSKPVKRDEPMNGAMKLFLAGCVAELYLLVIRRFYVSGTAQQLLACYAALLYIIFAGLAVLAVGLVVALSGKKKPKQARVGWAVFAAGAFLSLSALLIRTLGGSALTLLCVVVPVAMLLGILWCLYDRECAWSLTILAAVSDVRGSPAMCLAAARLWVRWPWSAPWCTWSCWWSRLS